MHLEYDVVYTPESGSLLVNQIMMGVDREGEGSLYEILKYPLPVDLDGVEDALLTGPIRLQLVTPMAFIPDDGPGGDFYMGQAEMVRTTTN